MNQKSLYVLLSTLLCLQQVSSRVAARDDAAQASGCASSNGASNLVARADGDVDDCEELELYDEGIDREELQRVENGDFDGFTATTCAVVVAYVLRNNNPGGGTSLGRRADTDETDISECHRAQDVLKKMKIPEPCRKIKDIEFGFTLSNDWWSGTKDDIGATISGPAGKAEFVITEQPSRGESKWVPVNMQESFKSDSIDITGINNLTLTAETFFLRGPQSDQFKVQDIRLRAKCADPGFEARNDQHVGINAWYGRPQKGWWIFGNLYPSNFDRQTVATFQVVPGDWSFAPPCNIIKDLSYEFTLGGTWLNGDGTGDTLTLVLGEGRVNLGNNFDAGSSKKDNIDLKAAFNKDTVDIRDLKTVSIDDDDSTAGTLDNAWKFQGLTLSATCADVPKKVQMRKFASENKDVSHKDGEPAWSGTITPADWLEVA
ncbi:hypothetical protein H634G_07022 [Metarhizium anisopliae BRIP 53293]|uniref:Protein-tyrosine phosphatase n=1 Tax=Metarhizium anisopliae BRIP 53293 TaxID=1291518 RepID=A0A0D9NU33_METAN|nr:hypothetical protein H634G_07022 [Metarhizium anisopliae BRIP 53293]KJK94747.1 hypothetical protein H633G_01349 [Metarhizium anisopliae BRIP 53284]